ncbi:MAG: aldehyde dehydrogenase family protein [Acidobacteriota bacterium]|nr:aldehyde dehydrogenase family protein [Blastocatellia bacterium]MDW8240970.1 aldehyde dehydrogenase family protein [Acidobacteriota bacterium]
MEREYLKENFIGGTWKPSHSRSRFQNVNPADTGDLIGEFPSSDREDVDEAVNTARQAFPAWRSLSSIERAAILSRAANLLESRLEEVARALTREEGKALAESRAEVARGVLILRYYAGAGLLDIGEVIPSANARSLMYTTRVPLGVVAVITPWNFPVAIPCWKIAPALIYGNTVVFKPSELSPLTAALIVELLAQAGVPAGVLNLVQGLGSVAGQALVEHGGINAITFTGSVSTGKMIARLALDRNVKYQLEMGGKNPAIVLDDADLAQATELIVSGAMRGAGERCTSTSRAIVMESVYDELRERILDRCARLVIGPGTDPSTDIGPLISEAQREKVLGYVELGKKEGAKLALGGRIPQGERYRHGYYVEPTVFVDVRPEMQIAQEEIFGPVLSLISVQTFEEALAVANSVRYGLSAALFTKDLNAALEFAERVEAGLVRVNGETAGVEPQAPFGGMKESSSYSREQGQAAKEFFTQLKTIHLSRAGM